MGERTHKDDFLASLERCDADENFIPSFYERFLASNDEVRAKFMGVDFEKQNKMLIRSLRVSAGATIGDPEALQEIEERGTTHDRHHLDIRASHYMLWLNAVIETAQEYDPEWDPEIEEAWRTILQFVIKRMIRMY